MKKVLGLILVAVLVISMGTMVFAATDGNSNLVMLPETPDYGTPFPNNGTGLLGQEYTVFYAPGSGSEITAFVNDNTESIDVKFNYIPQGVGGVNLISYFIRYMNAEGDKPAGYEVTFTTHSNPTVTVFENVTATVTIVKVKSGVTYRFTQTLTLRELINARHESDSVVKAADGTWYITATNPVIGESAFTKALNAKLSINYDGYSIIFNKVTNQSNALYLAATRTTKQANAAKANEPIVSLTFEPLKIQDDVTIKIGFSADQLNYQGTTVWVYDLDSSGKATGKGYQATLASDGTVMVEVPANTALNSLGVFASKQDTSSTSSSSTSSKTDGGSQSTTKENPNTGLTDTVAIASVFAMVSLAAAGFVAVRKAGK